MKTERDSNAFPAFDQQGVCYDDNGLTKREYFAAMAMQGFSASGNWVSSKATAEMAIIMADALINELNKEKSDGKES